MYELSHTLHSFVEALHRSGSVRLNAQGRWREESTLVKWIRRLTGQEIYARMELIRAFNAVLDNLETTPVYFSQVPGVVVSQQVDYHGFLSAAQSLRHYVRNDHHPMLDRLLSELKVKTLGLLYRLEEENGGLHTTEPPAPVQEQLLAVAEEWKKQVKIFWNPELGEGELRHLKRACSYTAFVRLLLEDKALCDDFFLWVLRDGLPLDVYIQFPALAKKITENNLRGRIGRMGQDFLKMRKYDCPNQPANQRKLVTLPFEGVEVSLLDENHEVIFKGNYKVKIKQVFAVFRDKLKDLGNFEMFAQGVLNWNSNCMGWWNNDLRAYELVDLESSDWWRRLPVLEVLTFEEAGKRFGVELDGYKWILAAKSARERVNLDYDQCHAYVEMAIPTPDHQYYITYTFGKAAIQLPTNLWERLFQFGAHVPATVVYPDETMYFTHRQQIGYTFELSEEEGMRLMAAFKEDIQRARTGNMVFQIEAENCGKWLQGHLEEHLGSERVPNLYRFPLLEAEPTGFMAKFFGFFQGLPRFCGNRLFILIHYPLGAWRGRWVVDKQGQKVWKSLLHSSFWKDAITYLPAYLHKQHEIGVFAEDPGRHKIWVEGAPAAQQKSTEPSPDVIRLFEDVF